MFLFNVAWNWIGVLVGLISGLVLSPYLIRKLGPDGYGVWALSFSMVEYYWLLDLGFRAATIKYVAHYNATKEPDKIAEVINTSLVYSSFAALFIFVPVFIAAPYFDRFFQISPAYHRQFPTLVILITISWCIGIVFNLFGSCLEAVQRFDLTNRVSIAGTTVRTFGTAALLYYGYGLIAIGIMVASSQVLMYVLNYIMFRRLFRQRLSPALATRGMLRQMVSFGIHTFLANISNQMLTQSTPVLIGHYLPARFVGFYSLPVRLMQYTVEMVGRMGMVTNSNAAELAATNRLEALQQLAVFPNRYCLMVFMPLAMFLWTHGYQLFRLWVGDVVAGQSAPLLPILLVGNLVAIVGQYSSTMLLQGLGRYQEYARGLFVEAVLGIATLVFVIPRYGLLGAACVVASFMMANRAIYASWLASRVVSISFWRYVNSIYTRPLLTAIPGMAIMIAIQRSIVPGNTWLQIAEAAAISGLVYYPIAYFTCTAPHHRELVWKLIQRKTAPHPA